MRDLKPLLAYVKNHKAILSWGILCLLISDALQMASPWILKVAVDGLETDITTQELGKYALILVAIAVGSGLFRFGMRRLIIGASRVMEYELRRDFFAHLTKLSFSFFNKTPTGDLMALATNDMNAVRMVLGPGIMYSINTVVILVTSLILMAALSWELMLAALIPMPLISFFMYRYGRVINKLFGAVQEQFADITARAQEYLSGIRVVKAYVQEEAAEADFEVRNQNYRTKYMKMIKLNSLMHPTIRLLAGCSTLIVLGVGGNLVINDRISLGSFVAFFAYLNMLIWPMIALGWVVTIFQRGAASMTRIQKIMNTEPDIADGPNAIKENIGGTVAFENVDFAYPSAPQLKALEGINLSIQAGETLGIAGRTGSGKTTLVNLILRLYDPIQGRVSLGDIDLRDISLESLRQRIGYVSQETFLFSMTVAKNISFGQPDASQNQVEKAARLAQMYDDIIDFPEQFKTRVGERGVTLSGGQKQRTAIARALLRNPEILILDDSLASVDTRTEEAILIGLRSFMEKRTTLLVSHRASTLQMADRIIVLDEGRIAEQGTHQELLRHGGIYADLARLQRLEDELEAADGTR